MAWLEAASIIFNAVVWLFLLAMAGLFVFTLICETMESIREHNRRAARLGAQVPPALSISEGWIGTGGARHLPYDQHHSEP
jgi:hypothetical protein